MRSCIPQAAPLACHHDVPCGRPRAPPEALAALWEDLPTEGQAGGADLAGGQLLLGAVRACETPGALTPAAGSSAAVRRHVYAAVQAWTLPLLMCLAAVGGAGAGMSLVSTSDAISGARLLTRSGVRMVLEALLHCCPPPTCPPLCCSCHASHSPGGKAC